MSEAPAGWEVVIGLEVHAQLKTASKIFCACAASFGGEPNSRCCPVCLGLPGALPVLNRQAVALALRVALATDCRVAPISLFARKHYFYPDLPKGYQITQYEQPLAEAGHLEIAVAGERRRIRIRRIHLEEDAGKSLHGGGGSRVDLNRAGQPLVEIVSEPDIGRPEEAHAYLTRLRQLLVYLEVCDGSMEEGSLRCDANLSLRRPGAALGVKTELKNLNSFRGVEAALHSEIARQAALLEAGGSVESETLLWDAGARRARPMRGKEETEDYRYLPEPDLPPLVVDGPWVAAVRAALPELPAARAARFQEALGLPAYDAELLTAEPDLAAYFEAVVATLGDAKLGANWVMGEVLRRAEPGVALAAFPVSPAALADLLGRVRAGELSNSAAKTVFERMAAEGGEAAAWIQRLGLQRLDDSAALARQAEALIAASPQELARYRGGEAKLFGWFVGQLMAASAGRADPREAARLLRERLDAPGGGRPVAPGGEPR